MLGPTPRNSTYEATSPRVYLSTQLAPNLPPLKVELPPEDLATYLVRAIIATILKSNQSLEDVTRAAYGGQASPVLQEQKELVSQYLSHHPPTTIITKIPTKSEGSFIWGSVSRYTDWSIPPYPLGRAYPLEIKIAVEVYNAMLLAHPSSSSTHHLFNLLRCLFVRSWVHELGHVLIGAFGSRPGSEQIHVPQGHSGDWLEQKMLGGELRVGFASRREVGVFTDRSLVGGARLEVEGWPKKMIVLDFESPYFVHIGEMSWASRRLPEPAPSHKVAPGTICILARACGHAFDTSDPSNFPSTPATTSLLPQTTPPSPLEYRTKSSSAPAQLEHLGLGPALRRSPDLTETLRILSLPVEQEPDRAEEENGPFFVGGLTDCIRDIRETGEASAMEHEVSADDS